jgi:hypothetical protein
VFRSADYGFFAQEVLNLDDSEQKGAQIEYFIVQLFVTTWFRLVSATCSPHSSEGTVVLTSWRWESSQRQKSHQNPYSSACGLPALIQSIATFEEADYVATLIFRFRLFPESTSLASSRRVVIASPRSSQATMCLGSCSAGMELLPKRSNALSCGSRRSPRGFHIARRPSSPVSG